MTASLAPQEYALHEIYAAICKHLIRHSSQLPSSGTTIDNETQYCSDCVAVRQLEAQHEEAKAAHESLLKQNLSERKTLRQARSRLIAAKVALLQHQDRQEKRPHTDRRDSGLPGIEEVTSELRKRKLDASPERTPKRVRFNEAQIHRPEGQRRFDEEFLRGSEWYTPGKWADKTGSGFLNTSNPYKEQEQQDPGPLDQNDAMEDVGEVVDVSGEDDWEDWEDQDDDLEVLSNEELEERYHLIEAQLAKLREKEEERK